MNEEEITENIIDYMLKHNRVVNNHIQNKIEKFIHMYGNKLYMLDPDAIQNGNNNDTDYLKGNYLRNFFLFDNGDNIENYIDSLFNDLNEKISALVSEAFIEREKTLKVNMEIELKHKLEQTLEEEFLRGVKEGLYMSTTCPYCLKKTVASVHHIIPVYIPHRDLRPEYLSS